MKAIKSKKTDVQTLLFPKVVWNRKDAAAWARKHGFKVSKVDASGEYLRYRQEDPSQYQDKSFRTIQLKGGNKPISAVIGRPWVIVGNPHCVLFKLIHEDWALHKKKHEIYSQLARARGTGKYSMPFAKRKLKSLAMEAARKYRRIHKIKPKLSVVFPPQKIEKCIGELYGEQGRYWKAGKLDQYLPRKAWSKRQEK